MIKNSIKQFIKFNTKMGVIFSQCYCKIPNCELSSFNFLQKDLLYDMHWKLHGFDKFGFIAGHLSAKCRECNFEMQWYDSEFYITAQKHMYSHEKPQNAFAFARCHKYQNCPVSLLDEFLCREIVRIAYE